MNELINLWPAYSTFVFPTAQDWSARTTTNNNCEPNAHFKKETDRTKGRGPKKEDFIDEIMKLNRERKVFSNYPIDWADTAIKCKMTCSPRGAQKYDVTGFKTIHTLTLLLMESKTLPHSNKCAREC